MDLSTIEHQIGETVRVVADRLCAAVDVPFCGVEMRQHLQPLIHDIALNFADSGNAAAVMADATQTIGTGS
ncbi:hypothetical protein [Nocardia abscessus]|uniref:hypothetical protein n=1 Tax=Nocardia abscessus TaxID=120957 RepID=UPI0024550ED7|nr:hypothetical protein [Nocardia abscessus]